MLKNEPDREKTLAGFWREDKKAAALGFSVAHHGAAVGKMCNTIACAIRAKAQIQSYQDTLVQLELWMLGVTAQERGHSSEKDLDRAANLNIHEEIIPFESRL